MHNASHMWGFNWIDAIVLLLVAGALRWGIREGLATQLLVIVGFFGTLFGAGWLFPHLLPFHNRTVQSTLNANLVLLSAIYVGYWCYKWGRWLHWSLGNGRRLRWLEAGLGCLPSLVGSLVLVWLLGTAVSRMPFAGFSNSVRDSRIQRALVANLPPVPLVFASFDKQVNPNRQPVVFATPKPTADFDYSAVEVQAAAARAANSVVRITSFGCGGIVTGSGFVAAPDMVVTNAHVIAGVERPIIKYQGQSYEGLPVLFDADLDFAVLRVAGLPAPAIALSSQGIHSDTTVAVLGYPDGNYRVAPGIIRENITAFGTSIYNVGKFGRDTYGVQTTIDHGSSGGPIVLANGQVAGVIYAKYDGADDYAYAVTSSYLLSGLQKAETSQRRVGTGACAAN